MTRKVATLWKNNPNKNADAVGYSSSLVTYNSATTPFSSSTVGQANSGKIAGSWSRQGKTATQFVPNPAANTNLYPYDSAIKTYDSATDTYDGIVSGQDFGDIETPTAWSEA
jgi:hypothetical protein